MPFSLRLNYVHLLYANRLWCLGLLQTLVQVVYQLFLVYMLTDEYNLLHAVTVLFIPISQQSRFLSHQFYQVFFGGGSIPLSGFGYFLLYPCLLKEE